MPLSTRAHSSRVFVRFTTHDRWRCGTNRTLVLFDLRAQLDPAQRFSHARAARKRIWCPLLLGRYQEKISTVTLLSLAVAVVFAIINLNYSR